MSQYIDNPQSKDPLIIAQEAYMDGHSDDYILELMDEIWG